MSFNFNEFLSDNNITIKRQVTSYKTIASDYLKNNDNAVVINHKNNASRGIKTVIYSLDKNNQLLDNEYNKNNGDIILAALQKNNIKIVDIKTLVK